uniref:Uncharacterized protein n=1 Tax=Acrobeloides nanus TaxID=290746 RepID=A0A914DBX0_9BILA
MSGPGSPTQPHGGVPEFRKHSLQSIISSVNSASLFKKVSIFAILPIAITFYLGYQDEKHFHEKMPEYKEHHVEYPFMNIRRRQFPWGDGNHTRFQGPNQYTPGVGWEDDEDVGYSIDTSFEKKFPMDTRVPHGHS